MVRSKEFPVSKTSSLDAMYTNSSSDFWRISARLSDNCPYLSKFLPANAKRPYLVGDKFAVITDDPAFNWNMACSYFEARRPLPVCLLHPVAYRAYRYLANRLISDRDLATAYAIQQSPAKRDVWRAFLVSGVSFNQIAQWLQVRVEVVHLFSFLFWNVGPWLNDGAHMAELLNLNELEPGDPGTALAQLAYLEGPFRLARAVGLPRIASAPESVSELHDRLERGILVRANAVVDRKSFSPKLRPIIRDGETLVLARKKPTNKEDDDMRRGLGGMSLAMAVNDDVQKIFEGDVNRRVALQLGQAVEHARETQGKDPAQTKQKAEGKSPV
jgi:hypothetical protein